MVFEYFSISTVHTCVYACIHPGLIVCLCVFIIFLMFYSVYVCSSVFSLCTGCFVYLMVIFSGLVVLAVLCALYILHV